MGIGSSGGGSGGRQPGTRGGGTGRGTAVAAPAPAGPPPVTGNVATGLTGTPPPEISQPFLGGSQEAEEEERKRLAAEQAKSADQVAADEAALGDVAGAAGNLADQGVSLSETGRQEAEALVVQQQEQLQQLFLRSMGVGVSPAEQAVNEAISQQQQGIESSVAGVQGRGSIAAQRQGGRAAEQLQARGEQQERLAGLGDQLQSQQLFGQTLGSFRETAALLGGLGAEAAGGALGLQGQALSDILGKDVLELSQLTEEELARLQLQLGADTNIEEIFAGKNTGSSGMLGGLTDLGGSLLGGLAGSDLFGGGGDTGGATGSDPLLDELGFTGTPGDVGNVTDDDLLGPGFEPSDPGDALGGF